VNALLTQLDKLKHRKNVLVMATSNLVKAIGRMLLHVYSPATYTLLWFPDTAFVDRADIIQYVDLPPREAIYDILRSSLCEMALKGVVAPVVSHISYCSKINDNLSRTSQR
jgi:SpoVK/Ycf46/Vps4 family AAA+-type ATPase